MSKGTAASDGQGFAPARARFKLEYKNAVANNVPAYILVDAQVYAEYQTFQKK
jgi:hypothetical protein